MFFVLKNLRGQSTETGIPWEGDWLSKVPENCFADKKARDLWINTPTVTYSVFSPFEGVNPNARINSGSDGEGNPPRNHHAACLDIDYPLTDIEVRAAIARMKIKPNWVERSLSNNVRLHWLFEKPVPMINYAFAVMWLTALEEILPFRQIAGIDEGALKAPERYYTNGGKWEQVHDVPVPTSLLLGQYQEVSKKFNWVDSGLGLTIPIDVAGAKLKEIFPRFSEWEGEFTLDSTGPSFWIDGSTSPKSCIVRATGLQTFSGHASKPFYNWSELLGHEFVKEFKKEELGKAVEGIFYDGRSYIRKNDAGAWLWDNKDELGMFLRTKRGLSDRRAKGAGFSQIDSALMLVKDVSHVNSAGSFAGYQKGLMTYNGDRYLNIHNKDVLPPSPEGGAWGSTGNFPFISKFYDGFFSSTDQLPFYLSWLARFYRHSFNRDPRSGQAVLIFGEPGRGKTFQSSAILSPLFGGHAEAKDWLNGEDTFNSELFECLFWTIDDGTMGTNRWLRDRFSEGLKRIVANKSFRSNEKFRKAGLVQWQGRILITGNTDPESLRVIPTLDISMREKVMLFRAADFRSDGFIFPDEGDTRAILRNELPFFASFLLSFKPPEHCLSIESRYGIREYHESSLLTEANLSSSSATFGEILDEALREFFVVREPESEIWSGTALQLHKMILGDHSLTEAMRGCSVQQVARNLAMLSTKKSFTIEIGTDDHRRIYTIHRDDRFPRKIRSLAPVQSEKFSRT